MKISNKALKGKEKETANVENDLWNIINESLGAAVPPIYNYLCDTLPTLISHYANPIIEKKQQENEILQNALSELQQKYVSLQESNKTLNEYYNKLMSEHAKYNRNDSGAINYENVILRDRFQEMGQEKLETIIKKILALFPDLARKERKESESTFFTKNSKNYVKYILVQNIFMKLTMDSTDITKDICEELGQQELSREWQQFEPTLRQFIEQCHHLVQQIWRSDPPGTVVLSRKGTLFDPNLHEASLGNEEEGIVTTILFPAYKLKDTILVKARVCTEAQKIISVQEKSSQEVKNTMLSQKLSENMSAQALQSTVLDQEQAKTSVVSEVVSSLDKPIETTKDTEVVSSLDKPIETTKIPQLPSEPVILEQVSDPLEPLD